jgi:16S rRNA C1402 N4-methylase RsmH
MNELYNGINLVQRYLKPKTGRLACISFHSLEDKIIKGQFNDIEINTTNEIENEEISSSKRKFKLQSGLKFKLNISSSLDTSSFLLTNTLKKSWTPLNKNKIIVPSDIEIKMNPRARSAKLRIACKN